MAFALGKNDLWVPRTHASPTAPPADAHPPSVVVKSPRPSLSDSRNAHFVPTFSQRQTVKASRDTRSVLALLPSVTE